MQPISVYTDSAPQPTGSLATYHAPMMPLQQVASLYHGLSKRVFLQQVLPRPELASSNAAQSTCKALGSRFAVRADCP